MDIAFSLNGRQVALKDVAPTITALDWLREAEGLTGTKEGCNEGDCGACTVMVTDANGTQPMNACLLFLPQLNGKALTTVEGLQGPGGALHPVQEAMVAHHGSQCGFCTPGIVMSLAAGQINDEADHAQQLAGNLCRCTGYAPILKAAAQAAKSPVPDWLAGLGPTHGSTHEPQLPTTPEALANFLTRFPNARIVGGATDVGLWVNKDMQDLGRVVFTGHIEEMRRIETAPYMMRIGAAASVEELRRVMLGLHPHFAAMLARFASPQIRAAATVGGNIANGSPIGDTPPALIALGATLLLRRGEALRELPLEDFFIDYGKQDLQAGEFVEAITIPRDPGSEDRLKVYKLSKRFDQDISAVLGAFNIHVAEGKVVGVCIAFGGMAGVPKRAAAMEAALLDQPWTKQNVEAAMAKLDDDFTPMSDLRASAEYRRTTAANMLMRYWLEDQGANATSLEEIAR